MKNHLYFDYKTRNVALDYFQFNASNFYLEHGYRVNKYSEFIKFSNSMLEYYTKVRSKSSYDETFNINKAKEHQELFFEYFNYVQSNIKHLYPVVRKFVINFDCGVDLSIYNIFEKAIIDLLYIYIVNKNEFDDVYRHWTQKFGYKTLNVIEFAILNTNINNLERNLKLTDIFN